MARRPSPRRARVARYAAPRRAVARRPARRAVSRGRARPVSRGSNVLKLVVETRPAVDTSGLQSAQGVQALDLRTLGGRSKF